MATFICKWLSTRLVLPTAEEREEPFETFIICGLTALSRVKEWETPFTSILHAHWLSQVIAKLFLSLIISLIEFFIPFHLSATVNDKACFVIQHIKMSEKGSCYCFVSTVETAKVKSFGTQQTVSLKRDFTKAIGKPDVVMHHVVVRQNGHSHFTS